MIRLPRALALVVLSVVAASATAQNAPIVVARPLTVGAITRDQGIWLGPEDNADTRGTVKYLVLLEADLAGAVSNLRNVSYQDRMATAELMHEVRMSSGRNFDPTTGAIRGLMGRLDLLIVIDAVDASTAKMRLIDVQTGAVKGVESCHRGSSACITGMTQRLETVAREIGGVTADLAAQRAEIMQIKPDWDAAVSRYDAQTAYWKHIEDSIRPAGHQLRPEISSLIIGAGRDVSTGRFAVEHLDTPSLKASLTALNRKLDRLEAFK